MTQEEALQRFQEMRPDHADRLSVEIESKIGYKYGESFYLWDYEEPTDGKRLIVSEVSWEDALAQVADMILGVNRG